MAKPESINPVAVKQAGISFSTIAALAETARALCVEVIGKMGDPEESPETFAVAARELCAQIGCLADISAQSLGSSALKGGTEDWLQPPIYAWAAEPKETTHG